MVTQETRARVQALTRQYVQDLLAAIDAPDASATRKRQPSAPATAPAKPSPTMRFGRRRGMPLALAEASDLRWYADALQNGIDDPMKAKFLDANVVHLAEVRAELSRRDAQPGTTPGRPLAADDDLTPL